MSASLHVHHLNCAHITTMKLGGRVLACHVMVVETPDSVWSWSTPGWARFASTRSACDCAGLRRAAGG